MHKILLQKLQTCCPVHPTKMGKIKTLEANPDGTGPQIWEDASSSTYVTRQAGTQFSVRSSNFRTIKHWSQSDEFCAGSLRTSPPPIPYMGPPERVLLDLCSQLRVLNRSQREHLRYLWISTSDIHSLVPCSVVLLVLYDAPLAPLNQGRLLVPGRNGQ